MAKLPMKRIIYSDLKDVIFELVFHMNYYVKVDTESSNLTLKVIVRSPQQELEVIKYLKPFLTKHNTLTIIDGTTHITFKGILS